MVLEYAPTKLGMPPEIGTIYKMIKMLMVNKCFKCLVTILVVWHRDLQKIHTYINIIKKTVPNLFHQTESIYESISPSPQKGKSSK
jgi:hypothetical protein